jgi:gas vesicle protein
MNTSKVVLGILGGLAVGAIAGILLAPDKGSNTRKKILDSGKGYMDDLKGKFDDLSKEVSNKYDNFVSDTKQAVENQTK